jgi:PfaB family protein
MRREPVIAVVGLGAVLPGAPDPDAYWRLVAERRSAAKDAPAGRWLLPLDAAYDPEKGAPDRVYSRRACFVEGFSLDPKGLAVDAGLLSRLDPLFHLTLHAGRQAFFDAAVEKLDRGRVGVSIGSIALPTDASAELTLRALGGKRDGTGPAEENRKAASLPAALLAKALGLGGGSVGLDAACASSLYAIKLAVEELRSGRADAMLTGGVSRPSSLYTQMGFSQLRALSPSGRCSPFDAAADGLVVGEGAALFLLKRLDDALAHADRIYGLVRAIGLSNDVDGSLLAPDSSGQLRAMRAAYAAAGWSPTDVDLVECHATGTPVGDAVEARSLQTLWGASGWKPGQCAIGSAKSNVGHLLTAAGAAGMAKVLLGMKAKQLPPSANFSAPNPETSLDRSPFRVQTKLQPWEARGEGTPRRAAVSAFGFGGINAHLLVEEYLPNPAPAPILSSPQKDGPVKVAVVGLEARFGAHASLREFQEAVLGGRSPEPARPSSTRKGAAPGFYMDEVTVAADAFRIPPKELEEMLPQQLLMLDVARAAIQDAGLPPGRRERAGAFVGIELDPATNHFHYRWAQPSDRRDESGPPLSANRTMGALGSIVASRVAREFRFGGPSFTLSSGEGSGLRALDAAVRALQRGELDHALAGAVDLAGEDRAGGPVPAGEGAAAVVLKRLDDAVRDGDRVYAVIAGVGTASSCREALERAYSDSGVEPSSVSLLEGEAAGAAEFFPKASAPSTALSDAKFRIGDAGAAAGLASVVKACLAVYHEILPSSTAAPRPDLAANPRFHAPREAQYWFRDRADGPRTAAVTSLGTEGNALHVIVQGADRAKGRAVERLQPLGARKEAVFVVESDTPPGLVGALAEFRQWLQAEPKDRGIELAARLWWAKQRAGERKALAVSFVASSLAELSRQIDSAEKKLVDDPTAKLDGGPERIFYSPEPIGRRGKLAFVFPGSGNQYVGMGTGLWPHWPEIPRSQDSENERLKSQFVPEMYAPWRLGWEGDWETETLARIGEDHRTLIFGHVSHAVAVSDLLRSFGLKPDASIGYSLGETCGLFAARAWRQRDEMLNRMHDSKLFVTELAGPCEAAKRAWGLAAHEAVDWALGVVDRPEKLVRAAVDKAEKVFLLIVNTPKECVVGGARHAVKKLAEGLGATFLPIDGVTTVHCRIAKEVEKEYRDLHLLETTPPQGLKFYSGAWARSYEVDRESAANAVVAQAVDGIDFTALIERAYGDGVRLFVETGPRHTCSRMISRILDGRPHLARSACVRDQDPVSTVLHLVAALSAERAPVDLDALYGHPSLAVGHREGTGAKSLRFPVGERPKAKPAPKPASRPVPAPAPKPVLQPAPAPMPIPAARPVARPSSAPAPTPKPLAPVAATQSSLAVAEPLAAVAAARSAAAEAHAQFLKLTQANAQAQLAALEFQTRLLGLGASGTLPAVTPAAVSPPEPKVFMTREQCLQFAVGKIGDVLGAAFAEADSFPTRVRLPDEPLMLVDRILTVEGEPKSLKSGRVVTEHDVKAGAWYLDGGRIPTCVAVEAGQADLFLSGYLGIDFKTRGLAMYRLLDAKVKFHAGLPQPGAVIHYDIKIDRFIRHGDTYLFFFNFESTVDGRPLLTMSDGCAGFFDQKELAAGQGIVFTEDDLRPQKGRLPADWKPLVPAAAGSMTEAQVDALRSGDLAAAFGPAFAGLPLGNPVRLPGGRMKLVDRVLSIEPNGGRYGLGRIVAEADIHPGDWHLVCHFIDDRVMPGTLMYECCLHTLRILLMRGGWIGEHDKLWHEPVPGVTSGLKCRGQVLESTQKVQYEISIKELGYDAEGRPFAIADALMHADGKAIVLISDMSIRLGGTSREQLEKLWNRPISASTSSARVSEPLYGPERILAFAVGKPSEAFGEPYKIFDEKRVIARLPGPPYQFLDRITRIEGGRPFVLEPGCEITAEYDVPRDAWYFEANRMASMPFAVLLEAALQPCGWLAAYLGSALHGDEDVSFRNLGGKAIQYEDVGPGAGTLVTTVKITRVSKSGGMIIENFDMSVACGGRLVYKGDTYFGFFTKKALSDQVGILGVKRHAPNGGGPLEIESLRSLPTRRLRMFDSIPVRTDGFLRGRKTIDPSEWFFKAHFYQDPVWPGSLGLEAFLQLLKAKAIERWGDGLTFEPIALGAPHEWVYRGQVLPKDKEVEIEAEIRSISDADRSIFADGFLIVDGRVIYQMKKFGLRASK